MHILILLLTLLVGLTSLGCWIVLLIAAFQDEVWKGLVSLFCGLYMLYYALAEFDHDYKWPIVLGAFGGGAIAAGISRMG